LNENSFIHFDFVPEYVTATSTDEVVHCTI